MPSLICPNCAGCVNLPPDWPHGAYTCPHCHRPATVLASIPAAGPLDFDAPPPARRPPASPHRVDRAFLSSFGGAFGHVLGVCLALAVVGVVVVAAVRYFSRG